MIQEKHLKAWLLLQENDNLYDKSNELEQYKGLQIAKINPHTNSVEFSNGDILYCGEATGNVDESTLRRLQIKETIKAHLEKEQYLFNKGIKVLSLFFGCLYIKGLILPLKLKVS